MAEEDAISFATLHLQGIFYDWWHHGLTTQVLDHVLTFEEFSQIILYHFERKDEDEYLRELVAIKQHDIVEAYVAECQCVVGMVFDVSNKRITLLFVEGLVEPLEGICEILCI